MKSNLKNWRSALATVGTTEENSMIKKMLCVSVMSIMTCGVYAQTITIQDLPEFDSVSSINDDDLIAGTVDSRAAIAKAGDIPTLVDGGLGSSSFPRSINDQGQVVGEYSGAGFGGRQAFAFDPDLGTIDLFVPDTLVFSSINNDLGQVFWATSNQSNSEQRINVLDANGFIQSIIVPSASIFDANDIGQVLSYEFGVTVSAVTTVSNTGLTYEPIRDPNFFRTELNDINNLGQVVGRVSSPNKAVIWDKNAGLRDLLAPGEADDFTSIASSINDSGLVALTLIPPAGFSDSEFAFYSPDDGLVRFAQPSISEPSACQTETFNVSSGSGVTISPTQDATLNESGQAIVTLRLGCRVGDDFPIIVIPAIATMETGIQLLPLPHGLEIEDLFVPISNEFGLTVNLYRSVDYVYGALNNQGKMIVNFRTDSWDGAFVSTAHIYDITLLSIPTVDDLIDEVERLLAAAVLSQDQANGLIDKLEAALKSIDTGKTKVTCNRLRAFINQVEGFVPQQLTEAEAQPLADMANEIRDNLGC